MRCLIFCFLMLSICVSAFAQSIPLYDRPVQHEPSHLFDVLHYRIALTFEGENRAFHGQTTITLRSLHAHLNQIDLHAETYKVDSVSSSNDQALSFNHTDGKLNVILSEPFGYGDTLSFTVTYGTEDFRVDPSQYGMGANYPLGIGFFDATEAHPFLFNAYSFPTGARHWFPCYDHPNDRASHETIITTLADHKVLANGVLEKVSKNDDNTVTYHWRQDQPHPTYLYNFVSGPYTVIEDSFEGLPVNYWAYPGDEDKVLRSFHRTPEVLAFFEAYYGVKYPWDKYDQIIVPGIGGGAEATTATLIGASTLHDERADPDFPSHWLVAHEAAHHWWGDYVSYRDWTETWLSESFATFSEYLYSHHLYGPDEGALNLASKRDAYLSEARTNYIRPIVFNRWEYPNQNFDRHTYQKGALVLNMLRDYLGEGSFRRVLKHFLTSHGYQPVDTHDFIKSIWEVTGERMDWFFDQWIFGAGHPILEISYQWVDGQVILDVNQVQDTNDHVPVFQMPVDIEIRTEEGIETKTIWIKEKASTFRFDVQQAPVLVRFDPENVLLKEWTFDKSKAELMYQAQRGDVISRIWAIQQLKDHLSDKEVYVVLEKMALSDPFWGIRKEALQTLAGRSPEIQRSRYMQALQDSHSHVRSLAIKLLGETKQIDIQNIYREAYAGDPSYLVQAEAIRALGKLQLSADKPLFEEVKGTKSPRNVLRQAGQWALDQIEK